MARPELISAKRIPLIIEAYQSGKKLRVIEEEFDVTRSQIYWLLQQKGVAPSRTKPKSRLDDGDERTVERLYEIVEQQDKTIRGLEELVERAMGGISAMFEAWPTDDNGRAELRDDAWDQLRKIQTEMGEHSFGTSNE